MTVVEIPRRHRVQASAFTMVELLVVVCVIALLLAMLTPSLKKARQQAKLTVCSANLHQIGTAMLMYAGEYDCFPILLTTAPPPYVGVYGFIEWSYGGWRGNPQKENNPSDYLYDLPPRRRPLSPYMFSGTELHDEAELPVFRCPSDVLSLQDGKDEQLSTYDDIGTSYTMNISWFWQPKPHMDPSAWRDAAEGRGNRIWKRYAQRGAPRFVMLAEDPVVYVLQPERHGQRLVQIDGWHGRFSTHNLAFLDGHVAYMRIDTSQYREAHWTVIDETLPEPPPPR